jgi:hypothetical protein
MTVLDIHCPKGRVTLIWIIFCVSGYGFDAIVEQLRRCYRSGRGHITNRPITVKTQIQVSKSVSLASVAKAPVGLRRRADEVSKPESTRRRTSHTKKGKTKEKQKYLICDDRDTSLHLDRRIWGSCRKHGEGDRILRTMPRDTRTY